MDPITAAIVGALTTGMASSLSDVTKTAIRQAYDHLKQVLLHTCDKNGEVARAIEQVEAKPDSAGRQMLLQEELAVVHAPQDAGLLHVAQELLQLLQNAEGAGPHTQTATGNYIAQADRGSSASVNINHPEKRSGW